MRIVQHGVLGALAVLGLLSFGALAWSASDEPALGVLRATPSGLAEPDAPITITFDRPVAGGLEEMVDPESIFRIRPAVEGRVEWRDPVTLRFTPAAPLRPGARYEVSIDPDFAAMDGTRLRSTYRFTFRVEGPRVLTGHPVNAHSQPRFLDRQPRFTLLLSSSTDTASPAARVHVALSPACGGPTTIPVRQVAEREIGSEDPDWFRYYGSRGNDRAPDLRRVVEFVPVRALPAACSAELVVPERFDDGAGTPQRWRFSTYGPLRVLSAGCATRGTGCHYGPAEITFTTPVTGAAVLRHVRLEPGIRFTVRDTSALSDRWTLEGRLEPRSHYTIRVAGALADAFEQRLGRDTVFAFTTPGVPPSVIYPHGRMIVERTGFRTIAVQHVNVDTLEVAIAAVPDSLEARFLSRGWGAWNEAWQRVAPTAQRVRVGVQNDQDRSSISGIPVPAHDARRNIAGTLLAVRISSPSMDSIRDRPPIALLQVTDIAIHARVGVDQGVAWVTRVSDGRPLRGAEVLLHDAEGRVRARANTDRQGIARLEGFAAPRSADADDECDEFCGEPEFEGYVSAVLGADRAVVGINTYDPDLAPWQFGVYRAWGEDRAPAAGAVFTERGIYRPGEPVYAKAILRHGPLGGLKPPAPSDSLRWRFTDREGAPVRDTVVTLSRFGTAEQTFRLPAEAPLGNYTVEIQAHREGRWRAVGWAGYQVAEYRPPEFLVEVNAPREARFAGDELRATVGARYLFGAPMAGASFRWSTRRSRAYTGDLGIPGIEGYYLGESGSWWSDYEPDAEVLASGVDTLDARGYKDLTLSAVAGAKGRPIRFSIDASVVDANRQTVSGTTSILVHPAEFYLGVRPGRRDYFWSVGRPVALDLIAVRPDGEIVPGVSVRGAVVRREWHRVRRERGGIFEEVGEWVADTVATCNLTTGSTPAGCSFTPQKGGAYSVSFTAEDRAGRTASTSFNRWTVGQDWVPWNDEGKFRIDVIPDRERYSVGDVATVLIASPFTDAEAWVTVERERVLEQRRIRITSGTTTVRLPITEAFAPNAFVSVVIVRGRSAPPGTVDDAGRPTLRVGYAELRVTPEIKRLSVDVSPLKEEYRPGDSAQVRVRVRTAQGKGEVSEVTLWAVDEGVLSLTGYTTPDPLDLLYQPRGLGMRLASNLVAVAPQVPEGQKGARHPGGGGGQDLTGVLRSRFRPTAFFLGSVVTNRNGEAVATAVLPDNITTFRVMAVAVTAGDRYGSGESPLLATRPLIARPALPRFLREGDDFSAGVVVNQRLGRDFDARVSVRAQGVELAGESERSVTLLAGRGAEARFGFRAPPGDSAAFWFLVAGGGETDAVEVRLPVRPVNRPVTHTVAGVLRDTATVEFVLPPSLDPVRSTLELGFGTSPLALIDGYRRQLAIYPYLCTEQISSQALPLIALYALRRELGNDASGEAERGRIENVVRTIARRQRPDGGIGLWSSADWTSPWLTAYAAEVLLEARGAGIEVNEGVLTGVGEYLTRTLREPELLRAALGGREALIASALAERLAAADVLSRLGKPEISTENVLLGQSPRLAWEDRLRLAEMVARRGATGPARQILESAWRGVQIRGTRVVLPDHAVRSDFYFASTVRPAARLLTATLAIEPEHPGIGALVETIVQQGRAESRRPWTTQDFGAAALALLRFEETLRGADTRLVRLRQGDRVLAEARASRERRGDSATPLSGLVQTRPDGSHVLRLSLGAEGTGVPVYYHLNVREVTSRATFTPLDRGITVERWYETLDTRRPVTSVAEGEVVRVRLRITVPEERQMVILDDPLPAGLEAVDLTLRTVSPFNLDPFAEQLEEETPGYGWYFGSWDSGMWSAFDHKEIRDDRVLFFARLLWKGSYTATYLARATTAGRFVSAPAHAEEMYNPGVHGRSGGGAFVVGATPGGGVAVRRR